MCELQRQAHHGYSGLQNLLLCFPAALLPWCCGFLVLWFPGAVVSCCSGFLLLCFTAAVLSCCCAFLLLCFPAAVPACYCAFLLLLLTDCCCVCLLLCIPAALLLCCSVHLLLLQFKDALTEAHGTPAALWSQLDKLVKDSYRQTRHSAAAQPVGAA
jgi:hypothetical protein